MSSEIKINSHKGEYAAEFDPAGIDSLNHGINHDAIYLIDEHVASLYQEKLRALLSTQRVLMIRAEEKNKSIEQLPNYINALVEMKIRRDHVLVGIGGGIVQDITCFLAATMMRGLQWLFYPTTLLAQADSCIGSKSSINCGSVKNILGTFTPPNKIVIDINFLNTLNKQDVLSGIGEMLKVHAVNSPESFKNIANNYDQLLSDQKIRQKFIYASLMMKKKFIEIDEFDKGPRNVLNYGHSFGHAIESATNYQIPHGIAVSMGMDIANYVASELGVSTKDFFNAMHPILKKNYAMFSNIKIDVDLMLAALGNDKKNSAKQLRLVLPNHEGLIHVGLYDNNGQLKSIIEKLFNLVSKGD